MDANIPESDRTVIALEQNRPGLVDLIVELTPGALRAEHPVMHLHPVESQCYLLANDFGFRRLPLSGLARNEERGRLEVVNSPIATVRGLAGLHIVQDLDLVTSAQVEAGVRFRSHLVLIANDEVLELLLGEQVRAVLGEIALAVHLEDVAQHAVLNAPRLHPVVAAVLPTLHGRAVEQQLEACLFLGRAQPIGCIGHRAGTLSQTQAPANAAEDVLLVGGAGPHIFAVAQ